MKKLVAVVLVLPFLAFAEPCEDLAAKVCEPNSDPDCIAFLDRKLVDPSGKPLSRLNRLMACKLASEDPETLELYRQEIARAAATTEFPFSVFVKPHKVTGEGWDALGGNPDLAACMLIGDQSIGCVPDGTQWQGITQPKCPDAFKCPFWVRTYRGATVSVHLVDVDAADNDFVGTCTFSAGEDRGVCSGQADIRLTYVPAKDAGAIVDRRLLGEWMVWERPEGADFHTVAFVADGRVILDSMGERRLGQYTITGIEGGVVRARIKLPGREAIDSKVVVRKGGLSLEMGSMVYGLGPMPE